LSPQPGIKLISDAREEWEHAQILDRQAAVSAGDHRQGRKLVVRLRRCVRRTAARAMAWIYHGEDDRPPACASCYMKILAGLIAMMDAVADSDTWIDDVGFSSSHHPGQ
jgi:hypothetical protein